MKNSPSQNRLDQADDRSNKLENMLLQISGEKKNEKEWWELIQWSTIKETQYTQAYHKGEYRGKGTESPFK